MLREEVRRLFFGKSVLTFRSLSICVYFYSSIIIHRVSQTINLYTDPTFHRYLPTKKNIPFHSDYTLSPLSFFILPNNTEKENAMHTTPLPARSARMG